MRDWRLPKFLGRRTTTAPAERCEHWRIPGHVRSVVAGTTPDVTPSSTSGPATFLDELTEMSALIVRPAAASHPVTAGRRLRQSSFRRSLKAA